VAIIYRDGNGSTRERFPFPKVIINQLPEWNDGIAGFYKIFHMGFELVGGHRHAIGRDGSEAVIN
jgi:hypothetical protein